MPVVTQRLFPSDKGYPSKQLSLVKLSFGLLPRSAAVEMVAMSELLRYMLKFVFLYIFMAAPWVLSNALTAVAPFASWGTVGGVTALVVLAYMALFEVSAHVVHAVAVLGPGTSIQGSTVSLQQLLSRQQ